MLKRIYLPMKRIFILILWGLCLQVNGTSGTQSSEDSEIRNVSLIQKHEYISCSDGWYQYGHKCFKAFEDKVSWQDALKFCSQYGGSLASIHSDEERDFLVIYLLLMVQDNLWIGLHDQLREARYEWSDNTPYKYNGWDFLEPSDDMRAYRQDEDCAEMRYSNFKTHIGTWNDIKCNEKRSYICQKDKAPQQVKVKNPIYCGKHSGWKFKNSCFYYVAEPKTWKKAEEYCQSKHQGHLVSIRDKATEIFFQTMSGRFFHSHRIWIGIKLRNSWQQVWSAGWFVSYRRFKNEEFREGDCVIIEPNANWTMSSCTAKHSFVCEYSSTIPPTLPLVSKELVCPKEPNFWRDLGGQFCYYIDPDKSCTWSEANFLCKQRGGTLASIHSQAELDVLHQVLDDTQPVISIGLYRKLARDGKDEEFAWVDKSPLNFTAWDKGEPNSQSELCTELRIKKKVLNDIPCYKKIGYICSVKKIPRAVRDGYEVCEEDDGKITNQSLLLQEGKCPNQEPLWTNTSGSYCYAVISNRTKTAYEASFECMRIGGTLASIHSLEESEILQPLLKEDKSYWIGLIRRTADDFFWEDGSPVDFTNWNPDKQNNRDHVCTRIHPGMTWSSYACYFNAAYICSAKKTLDGTPPKSTKEICHYRIIREHEQTYAALTQSICSSNCQKALGITLGSLLGFVLIAILVYVIRPFRRVPDDFKGGILQRLSSLNSWQSLSNKEEANSELRSLNK